jgi:ABC-type sugar transport system substrate-binding protein
MVLRSRVLAASVAALAMVVFVAGCGDDENSSSGENTGAAAASKESGGKADAQAAVEKFQQTSGVEWPQPTESFDPGTGKVAVISCGNAGINCLKGSEDAQAAAKAMGWEPSPIFDGEFTPAKQAGFVQQAIQENYDGIILVSIDANSIKAALDAAVAKKIPIACVMCVNPDWEGKVIDVSTGGVAEGEAIGSWVAANADSSKKIVGFDDKSFPIVAERRTNAMAKIEEYCPDCQVEEADYPTTDLSKAGQPTFTGTLNANPSGSLGVVMAPYDPAAIPMAKAAEQQGRSDFKMTGYDASPDYLAMIKEGTGGAAATTAVPFPFSSWGAMDQVARIKAGKEPWESNRLPSALVTADNADEFGEFGFFTPDFDFEAKFKELWGQA